MKKREKNYTKITPQSNSENFKITTQSTCTSELHVLAVDDSLIDRKVIEKLLKVSSFKVTTVSSALGACEILGIVEGRASIPDNATFFKDINVNLIITDYCMPEMTGYDLLKKVKESAALKEIPVVIMSSENVPTRIERCLEEGAKEFIIKPVRLADIKRISGHFIGNQPAHGDISGCCKRELEIEGVHDQKLPHKKTSSEHTYANS